MSPTSRVGPSPRRTPSPARPHWSDARRARLAVHGTAADDRSRCPACFSPAEPGATACASCHLLLRRPPGGPIRAFARGATRSVVRRLRRRTRALR